MKIEALYQLFTQSSGVCTDTRKVKPGSLFIALKGENFNGNKFALKAIEQGCSAAIVDEPIAESHPQVHTVQNGLSCLQELAQFHRKKLNAHVIGITGSNGKTTSKELAFEVLSKKFKTFATPGNFNNHIGLPLTLLETPLDTEVLLLEMGDSKTGDILELCEISDPDFGYITNIGKDHIGGFGTIEANIAAKKELFDYLKETKKPAFLQENDELLLSISEGLETISIPLGTPLKIETGSTFLKYTTDNNSYTTHLVGSYNILNIQFAVSLGRYLQVAENDIHAAVCNYKPSNNRSQLIDTPLKNQLILDAYNANPSSVELALQSMIGLDHPNKVVILGDMLELGSISNREHGQIVKMVCKSSIEKAFFVGSHYKEHENSSALFFASKKELALYLEENPINSSLILLKGSRGIALETLKELV